MDKKMDISQIVAGDVFVWGGTEYLCKAVRDNRCEVRYGVGNEESYFNRSTPTLVELIESSKQVPAELVESSRIPVYDYSVFVYSRTPEIQSHINAYSADGWEFISMTGVGVEGIAVLMMKF